MTTQQLRRVEQREHAQRRRIELAEQVTRGEEGLFASSDDRTRRVLDQKLTVLRKELRQLEAVIVESSREPFSEFNERMGCEYIHTRNGNLLFANGGLSDGRWNHVDPPADALAMLRFKIEFLEYRLADSQKQVEAIEGYVRQQSQWHAMGAGPLPEDAAYDELQKKRSEVEVFNKQLTKARQELCRLTGPSQRECFEAQAAGRQRAAEAAMARAFNS